MQNSNLFVKVVMADGSYFMTSDDSSLLIRSHLFFEDDMGVVLDSVAKPDLIQGTAKRNKKLSISKNANINTYTTTCISTKVCLFVRMLRETCIWPA